MLQTRYKGYRGFQVICHDQSQLVFDHFSDNEHIANQYMQKGKNALVNEQYNLEDWLQTDN